jgi:hypothetical protein
MARKRQTVTAEHKIVASGAFPKLSTKEVLTKIKVGKKVISSRADSVQAAKRQARAIAAEALGLGVREIEVDNTFSYPTAAAKKLDVARDAMKVVQKAQRDARPAVDEAVMGLTNLGLSRQDVGGEMGFSGQRAQVILDRTR